MLYLVLGIALIGAAGVMMFIARPTGDKPAALIENSVMATGYALAITCIFALGLGSLILSFSALSG